MSEIARLFLPVMVCAVGAALYAAVPSIILLVARVSCGGILVAWLALLITGNMGDQRNGPHRFLAHGFIILVWCAVPLLAGVSIGAAIQARKWLRLTHPALPGLAIVTSFLAAFSGYMVRDSPTADQIIRFHALHKLAFPTMTGVFLLAWLWVARRYDSRAA